MRRKSIFQIDYVVETIEHLDAIERKYHRLISKTIIEQLSYTPTKKTRNRKLLEQPAPFEATWEIRFGSNNRFRVLYDVNENEHVVTILAIGVKRGNSLIFGGERYET
jgi:mRNA-degrading endonuclease RelE of RelBE toxin-antitoxin system